MADEILERSLGIDVNANLRRALSPGTNEARDRLLGTQVARDPDLSVLRAGFKDSGVSQANRLIERHRLPDGRAYWKSYDFRLSNQVENDLFRFPLGPRSANLSQSRSFQHDGGEVIFHLPNGLQAYLLTTASGTLLTRAPSEIVQDRNRRDGTILNGISCIKCHDAGMKRPPGVAPGTFRDEIHPGVEPLLARFTRAEQRAVAALYVDQATLNETLDSDARRFTDALRAIGSDQLTVEPIGFLYDRFVRDITASALLAELDINPASVKTPLAEVLRSSDNDLIKTKATQLGRGFRRAEFIPLFRAIAAELSDRPLRLALPVAYEEFAPAGFAGPNPLPRPSPPARTLGTGPQTSEINFWR